MQYDRPQDDETPNRRMFVVPHGGGSIARRIARSTYFETAGKSEQPGVSGPSPDTC